MVKKRKRKTCIIAKLQNESHVVSSWREYTLGINFGRPINTPSENNTTVYLYYLFYSFLLLVMFSFSSSEIVSFNQYHLLVIIQITESNSFACMFRTKIDNLSYKMVHIKYKLDICCIHPIKSHCRPLWTSCVIDEKFEFLINGHQWNLFIQIFLSISTKSLQDNATCIFPPPRHSGLKGHLRPGCRFWVE